LGIPTFSPTIQKPWQRQDFAEIIDAIMEKEADLSDVFDGRMIGKDPQV
jgi:hypothetical protein